MKTYAVMFTVTEDKLTTVIDTIKGEVSNLEMREVPVGRQRKRKKHADRYDQSHPYSATTTGMTTLGTLAAGKTHRTTDVGKELNRITGLAENSAASAISYLKSEGKVERVERGKYRLATVQ